MATSASHFYRTVRCIIPRFVGHNSRIWMEGYRTCHYGAGARWLGRVVVEYQRSGRRGHSPRKAYSEGKLRR